MTKKDVFKKKMYRENWWYSLSLLNCVEQISDFYECWAQMNKNARKETRESMELVLRNFLKHVNLLTRNDWEKEEAFKKVRLEFPEMDILFTKLNKEFPNQKVLYRLSTAGYIKP